MGARETPCEAAGEAAQGESSAPVPWGPTTSCPCGSTGKGYARDQLIELDIAKPQLVGARGAIAKPDLRFADLEAPPTAEHTWLPPEDAAPPPPPSLQLELGVIRAALALIRHPRAARRLNRVLVVQELPAVCG